MLAFLFNYSNAQVSHYSQFYSTPMTIAPSFAGMTPGGRVALNYRDQWPSIAGTFKTYSVAVDHYIPRAKSGIGAVIFRDVAGAGNLGLTEYGLQYSYKLKVGHKRGKKNTEWFLRPGLYFKYAQRSINYDKLTFGDEIKFDGSQNGDGSIEPFTGNAKKGYLDAAASLVGYTQYYWGGFSVDHLLKPDQSLTGIPSRLPYKLSVFGGYKWLIQDKRSRRVRYGRDPESLTFTFHYRLMGQYDQLDIGAYWNYDPLILGAWFRGIPIRDQKTKKFEKIDAIIILLGFKVNENLRIGYSYDITISNLISHTGGAHEVSVVYEFNKDIAKRKHKHVMIPCPAF